MNAPERGLPAGVRGVLEAHLDSVEHAVSEAGLSRSEVAGVRAEVETHALEMLWQRVSDVPTENDMRAILAELDDPEAYRDPIEASQRGAEQPVAAVPSERTIHPLAVWTLLLPVGTVLLILSPLSPRGEVRMLALVALVSLSSILLGAFAIREIRRSPARYAGVGLAIGGMALLPAVVIHFAAYLFVAQEIEWRLVGHALAKQAQAERARESERVISEFNKENDFAARVQTPQSPELSEREKWAAENATVLSFVVYSIVMGLAFVVCVAPAVVAYRFLRPAAPREGD